MYNSMKSFDESVACHLELSILSRKFGITGHGQSSVVEYFSLFQQNSLEVLQDLHFHQIMGIRPQKPVIYGDFSILQNNTS